MNDIVNTWKEQLANVARPQKVQTLSSFFKTAPGEYGEGDKFIGVMVPDNRATARLFADAPAQAFIQMLHSPVHEHRLSALLALVARYKKAKSTTDKDNIATFYIDHCSAAANNWDLVDLSAPYILGDYLLRNPSPTLLDRLSRSSNLWQQRIAIVATLTPIRHGNPDLTLPIAERYISHNHPLIHKATGWMLREIGKHCSLDTLFCFLDKNAPAMPRVMLSYAVERLDPLLKSKYRSMPRR